MKTIISMKTKIYLVAFNLCYFVAMANDDTDPGLPGEDPGTAAPIDNWIVLMFIIGVLLLFYSYKKHQKTSVVSRMEKSK